MSEWTYGHDIHHLSTDRFGSRQAAVGCAVAALAGFFEDAERPEFVIAQVVEVPWDLVTPPTELIAGIVSEHIRDLCGAAGDAAASWIEDHLATRGTAAEERVEGPGADLQTNLAGLLTWWADRHECPPLSRIEGIYRYICTRSGGGQITGAREILDAE